MAILNASKEELQKIKEEICATCRHLYTLGWVSGTGGGISVRAGDLALIAPSGVEKEKLSPEDIFETDLDGQVINKSENSNHKLSACAPLFLSIYKKRGAGAVIHSHSMNGFLASKIAQKIAATEAKDSDVIAEIKITEIEMLKGIKGQGYHDTHIIPVIKNTAHECDLTDSLNEALDKYPGAYAVVVQNHGIYAWGDNKTQAKTHAECYDFLFEAYTRVFELGL